MKTFSKYFYVLFAALFVLAGCGGGGGSSSVSAVSGSSRVVTITSNPAGGATNVPLNQVITVTFSNTMLGSTINSGSFQVNSGAVTGTISPTGNASTYTFTPTSPLAPNTTYTVTLSSSIKISAGYNIQSTLTFSFTTGAAPASLYYGGPTTLKAVNPYAPAAGSNLTVSAVATTGALAIQHGTFTQATATLSNLTNKTVVYASGGKIYGSTTTAPTTAPSPFQISSESAATSICTSVAAPDYANHNNAAYIYSLPGADTLCNTADDVYKMVKVGFANTTAPVAAFKVVTVINDPLTGAISGYLALNGTNLNRYDANFASPVLVMSAVTSAIEAAPTSFLNVYLVLNGKLYNYSFNTGSGVWSLSAILHTFASAPVGSLAGFDDGAALYFADGGIVYSIAHAAAGPTVVVSDGGVITNIVLTNNRVVFGKSATLEVKSVPKTGAGAATTLVATNGTLVGASSGGKVFYTLTTVGNPTAGVVNEDGTGKVEVANSNWAGQSLPTSYTGVGNQWFTKILMIDSTGVLKAIDPTTGSAVSTIGTVSGLNPFTFFASGRGNYLLGSAQDALASPTNTDVYFVDVNAGASLNRLTNTAGVHEFIVY